MPEYKYLMKIAVDYGNTNTIMAHYIYERNANGDWVICKRLQSTTPVRRIPTIMLLAEDNPGHVKIKQDVYGVEAEQIIRESNQQINVCDNFKKLLYTEPADSEGYEMGKRLTALFFRCLRQEYMRSISNLLLPEDKQDMRVELYLSTPLRAAPTHHSLMRELATEAGFTEENGVHEIITDYDEAQCVVFYAMALQQERMRFVLKHAGNPKGANILFLDFGGSTLDMVLKRYRITKEGSAELDHIAAWPELDEKNTLGGSNIDEAIRDYLIATGCANESFTMKQWNNGRGKFRFRTFKEEQNERLKVGGTIENLGELMFSCMDFKAPAARYYDEISDKINSYLFETKICRDYIVKFLDALETLFRNQRLMDGEQPLIPEDVDAVFVSGDGSKLYFIRDILMGDFARKYADDPALGRDPGFSAIKQNPRLLFDDWEEPSLCCALGALEGPKNLTTYNYTNAGYLLDVYIGGDIYSFEKSNKKFGMKEGFALFDSSKIAEFTIPLVEKHTLLPNTVCGKNSIVYYDQSATYDWMKCRIILKRRTDDGELIPVGEPYWLQKRRKRYVGEALMKIPRFFGAYVKEFTAEIKDIAGAIRGVEPTSNFESRDLFGQALWPEQDQDMVVNYEFTFTENNQIVGKIETESRYFILENGAFTFTL